MPTPSSRTSMSTPPLFSSMTVTRTWELCGENSVAFSMSSASRCTTSAAACPETMIPGWTARATRLYCSISEAAARATSLSGTDSVHLRTGSSPARTSRFSEFRRIRVIMWSMEKRLASWSGSSSLCSIESIIRASRSISGTLRRDKLMNIALRLPRSCASFPASRTASACTWSNARATRPISSVDCTPIGSIVAGVSRVSVPAAAAATRSGSRFVAISSASACSLRSGLTKVRPTQRGREQHEDHRARPSPPPSGSRS